VAASIIALFNQSGGVGKTTLTMNIGYHLGELGRKVLLIRNPKFIRHFLGFAVPLAYK
jgi:septum formation inhibitor-activating ATPase MinD